MEKVDVYNEHDEKTGEVKDKNEAHKDGTWHHTVHVWIINSKHELLIQRRAPEKEAHPNMWGVSTVGGHISAGDNATVTAIRETQEELGLTIESGELEYLFTSPHEEVLNNGTLVVKHFDESFLVEREVDIPSLTLQANEVSEVKWIHFTELEKHIQAKDPEFIMHLDYDKLFPLLYERYAA